MRKEAILKPTRKRSVNMPNDNLTKDEQAKSLAKTHYAIEEGVTQVIRFSREAEVELVRSEPIKLLEVNVNTVPSGIMPIQFAPNSMGGITYPLSIIEVTPDEYRRIETHELKLPDGWSNPELIPRVSE